MQHERELLDKQFQSLKEAQAKRHADLEKVERKKKDNLKSLKCDAVNKEVVGLFKTLACNL